MTGPVYPGELVLKTRHTRRYKDTHAQCLLLFLSAKRRCLPSSLLEVYVPPPPRVSSDPRRRVHAQPIEQAAALGARPPASEDVALAPKKRRAAVEHEDGNCYEDIGRDRRVRRRARVQRAGRVRAQQCRGQVRVHRAGLCRVPHAGLRRLRVHRQVGQWGGRGSRARRSATRAPAASSRGGGGVE